MSEIQTPLLSEKTHKLNSMAQDAASVEGDGGFMRPGTQAKKGRGRPRKDATGGSNTGGAAKTSETGGVGGLGPSPDNTETFKQILSPVWQTISASAIEITDEPDAGMKPVELQLITDSSAACINQYFPDALGKHANLLLFMTVSSTWSMRVWLIYTAKRRHLEELKRQREKEVSTPPVQ